MGTDASMVTFVMLYGLWVVVYVYFVYKTSRSILVAVVGMKKRIKFERTRSKHKTFENG